MLKKKKTMKITKKILNSKIQTKETEETQQMEEIPMIQMEVEDYVIVVN